MSASLGAALCAIVSPSVAGSSCPQHHLDRRLIQWNGIEPARGGESIGNRLCRLPGNAVRKWAPEPAHRIEETAAFEQRQQNLLLGILPLGPR